MSNFGTYLVRISHFLILVLSSLSSHVIKVSSLSSHLEKAIEEEKFSEFSGMSPRRGFLLSLQVIDYEQVFLEPIPLHPSLACILRI